FLKGSPKFTFSGRKLPALRVTSCAVAEAASATTVAAPAARVTNFRIIISVPAALLPVPSSDGGVLALCPASTSAQGRAAGRHRPTPYQIRCRPVFKVKSYRSTGGRGAEPRSSVRTGAIGPALECRWAAPATHHCQGRRRPTIAASRAADGDTTTPRKTWMVATERP